MVEILKIGKIVKIGNSEYIIERLLGSGTQGEVYAINYDNNPMVLKFYFPHMAGHIQREIVNKLIDSGPPSEKFLWPMKLVDAKEIQGIEGIEGFGYIMPFKEDRYVSFSLWMNRKVYPTFKVLVTSCLELSKNFLLLHSQGLCYQDISLNNIFFDPSNGDIRIGDTDNIVVNGKNAGNIYGTPKFMAPEIVRGEGLPNSQTDLFSLSVLLFAIMHVAFPLDGLKETQFKSLDFPAMKKLYGENAVFIFDPMDDSNRPDPRFHDNANIYWKIYPQFLRDLFIKAFTDGIRDPQNGRVRESEWQEAFARLRDLISYCGKCRAENFNDPKVEKYTSTAADQHICYSCKNNIASQFWIRIEEKIIMLNYDTKLYYHHIDPHAIYDYFSKPVAEMTTHPKDPKMWGLKNLTGENWTIKTKEGKTFDIDPGKSVPLKVGTKIYFGKTTGEIQY
jgi:eukaryotic-like serine/threonine-protein kinase